MPFKDFKSQAKRGSWPVLAVAVFFACVSAVLFFPALFSGRLISGYDLASLGIPFYAETQRSLAAHQWPLWMPDVLGGIPGIASCNLLFCYPTDFIGSLAGLSLQRLLGLDAGLHVALSGVGMFLFLRRLDRGFSSSLLGAFFFALSGSQVTQLSGGFYNFVEGIALVPWAFWAAHKGRSENSRFAWGLCGLAFAMQILAGGAQLFAYTLAAVFFFVLSEVWNRDPGGGLRPASGRLSGCLNATQGLGLALGTAFLLSAPQLWPTLRYLPLSMRQGYTYAQFIGGSISLSDALLWLVPGWHTPTFHGSTLNCTGEYFGLLPWTLAAGALLALWRKEPRVRWMSAMLLWVFFFAQNRWAPFYGIFHRLPIISGFRFWSRLLFLVPFSVCTLSAYGWDALRGETSRPSALKGALLFLGAALTVSALAWGLAPAQAALMAGVSGQAFSPGEAAETARALASAARASARTTLALGAGLLALLLLWRKRPYLAPALILALCFHTLDQGLMLRHFVKFMDPRAAIPYPRFLAPPPAPESVEPWRIAEVDRLYPNDAVLWGYENLEGLESVPLQSYARIKDALRARPGEWYDLLGVRYCFFHSAGASVPGDRMSIVENRGAFPRAWLVGSARETANSDAACALLADPRFDPRTEAALPVDADLPGGTPRGSILWTARSPQSFSLDVSTDRNAALLVSNFWYPDWKAAVDGRESPVLEADGGLQAVLIGKGEHRVDFRFDPGLFNDALAACLAGLVFLLGLAHLEKKRT